MNTNPVFGEIEEIEDVVEKEFKHFKNFQLNDDSTLDHRSYLEYYRHKLLLESNQSQKIEKRRDLLVKIKQEWQLLEQNLPDSIFVRAYNTRVDLMRAAIIGPPDTPYSHGLFFFDIFIPKGYPSCPPKLLYHSYNLTLSPSLSMDGKVTLKLLEPPDGRIVQLLSGAKQEKWNPKESTILDVLLAVQSSIFNNNPYNDVSFLERCHWHNGAAYNKNVWLSTCEGMLRTLQKPPRDFVILVRGHFRMRAHSILMKFRGTNDAEVFHKLLTAFEANGTYCKHHLSRQVKEEKVVREGKKQKNEYVMKLYNNLMTFS